MYIVSIRSYCLRMNSIGSSSNRLKSLYVTIMRGMIVSYKIVSMKGNIFAMVTSIFEAEATSFITKLRVLYPTKCVFFLNRIYK